MTDTAVAFEPKAAYTDPDSLGTIFINDEGDLNLRDALKEGKGQIVTSDPAVIARLDAYDAVKRVAVDDTGSKSSARGATSTDAKGSDR